MCVYVYSSIVEPSGPHAWCCRCPRRYLSINKTLSLSLLSTLSLCWRGGSPVYSSSLALSLSLPPSTQEAADHLASIAAPSGSLISKGSQVPFAGHSDTTRVMRLEVPQRTVCCKLVPESELRPMEAFGGTFQASCNCTAPHLDQSLSRVPNLHREGWRVQPHALHCV